MNGAGATGLALAAAGIVLAAVLGWVALQYLRAQMRARCARLEEALRIYNNANAAIGRHVTALEAELHAMRQRLAAMEGAGARTRLRETPCVAAAGDEPGDDAEQRLSRLIRSRLGEPRAVV